MKSYDTVRILTGNKTEKEGPHLSTRVALRVRGSRQVCRVICRLLSCRDTRLTNRRTSPRQVSTTISPSHSQINRNIFWLATFTDSTHTLSTFSGVPRKKKKISLCKNIIKKKINFRDFCEVKHLSVHDKTVQFFSPSNF